MSHQIGKKHKNQIKIHPNEQFGVVSVRTKQNFSGELSRTVWITNAAGTEQFSSGAQRAKWVLTDTNITPDTRSSAPSFGLWADAEHVGRNLPPRILEGICNNILPGEGWASCPGLSSHEFFFQGPNDNSGALGSRVPWAAARISSKSHFYLWRLRTISGNHQFCWVRIIDTYLFVYKIHIYPGIGTVLWWSGRGKSQWQYFLAA